MPNHSMNSGTSAKDGIGISALTSGRKKFSTRLEARHQDAERQADHNGEAEAEQHAVKREGGVFDHGAVGQHRKERARDRSQRRQQRRREIAAARQPPRKAQPPRSA